MTSDEGDGGDESSEKKPSFESQIAHKDAPKGDDDDE